MIQGIRHLPSGATSVPACARRCTPEAPPRLACSQSSLRTRIWRRGWLLAPERRQWVNTRRAAIREIATRRPPRLRSPQWHASMAHGPRIENLGPLESAAHAEARVNRAVVMSQRDDRGRRVVVLLRYTLAVAAALRVAAATPTPSEPVDPIAEVCWICVISGSPSPPRC